MICPSHQRTTNGSVTITNSSICLHVVFVAGFAAYVIFLDSLMLIKCFTILYYVSFLSIPCEFIKISVLI